LGSKVELGLVLLVRKYSLNDVEHCITVIGSGEVTDAEAKDKLILFERVRLLLSVSAKTNQPEKLHARDPPVGGHSCNGEMIPRFDRAVCD
jgi:hypothetical protein